MCPSQHHLSAPSGRLYRHIVTKRALTVGPRENATLELLVTVVALAVVTDGWMGVNVLMPVAAEGINCGSCFKAKLCPWYAPAERCKDVMRDYRTCYWFTCIIDF